MRLSTIGLWLSPGPARLTTTVVATVVATGLVAGCARDGEPAASSQPLPLRVEWAGCDAALPGRICTPPADGRLTLWIEAPPEARLAIDATLIEGPTEVQLGRRYQVRVAAEARELVVRATDGERSAAWRLALRSSQPPGWRAEAEAALRAGEADTAAALLDALPAAEQASGFAVGARARLELRRGETGAACALLKRSVTAHRQAGRLLAAGRDAAALTYLATYREHDLAAARRALSAIPDEADGPAENAFDRAYYGGLLAAKSGDLRTALRSLTAAARQAERAGLSSLERAAEQALAWRLQVVGREAEATALLRRLVATAPADLSPCRRGQLLNNAGWGLLHAPATLEAGERPADYLEEALEIFEQSCPQLPHERLNVLLSLVLAHLEESEPAAARQRLAQALEPGPIPEPRLRIWRRELEGRLALAEGRPKAALRRYGEMARLAAAGLEEDLLWRAAGGRARALAATGRVEEALAALAEAEHHLDEASLMVPFTAGRDTFLAERQGGVVLYLELLLENGRPEAAFALARRSRSRVLRGLLRRRRLADLTPDEQGRWDRAVSAWRARRADLDAAAAEDWQLSAERLGRLAAERAAARGELLRDLDDLLMIAGAGGSAAALPAPRTGELTLLYHPLATGWAGFAHDGERLAVRRLPCEAETAADELGPCLLEPFRGEIERAAALRLLPYGALRQVDLHALRFGGSVLLAAKPVLYGLDLPRLPATSPAPPLAALVVADPGGDLPAARREAAAVAAALADTDGGWEVRRLLGAEATGSALRSQLPRTDLLHYAGHGTFAGAGGWESALPLAAGGRLTVGDVLTLEAVPREVVLSGCETARAARAGGADSLGLAHAFLVAGSRSVLAATRPVDDATAFALVSAFYRERSRGAPPALALRRAQLALLAAEDPGDWATFRLIEP